MPEIFKLLLKLNLTLATCESITGGAFSESLIKVPGASKVFLGSIIAYSNRAKINLVGVDRATLYHYGAVSIETTIEMAENTKKILKSDIVLSFTGVAGPDPVEDKPIGLVYIGFLYLGKCTVYEYQLSGDRKQIIRQCVNLAKEILKERLK